MALNLEGVRAVINSLDRDRVPLYHTYFDTLRPTSEEEVFRRALFAFASVHTTWELNCQLYLALLEKDWWGDVDRLRWRIRTTGAGLHNNRTKFIWKFNEEYWRNPEGYLKQDGETWPGYRNRIERAILGLGHAKSSFFVEMVYFQRAHVVCEDTHVLALYGVNPEKTSRKLMNALEEHWVETSLDAGVPPVTARWMFWDRKQNKQDSRYWSYVLELNEPQPSPQMELWPLASYYNKGGE